MKQRIRLLSGIFVVAALFLAGCGDDDDGDAAGGDIPEECQTLEVGWIPWDENIAGTNLWETLLEERGYEVETTQLDAGLIYQGLAEDDLDLFLDAWLPVTHEDYWEQYGDQIDDLGIWFEPALLTIAVPDYVEVTSLEELGDNADTFDGQIVGIEPGAGLTRITSEEVMPGYGLEGDFELLEGSTPTMLTELERAIDDEEPVVVTLWRPHWAYAEFPIRDLEDPQGLLGDAEEIHSLGRSGFSEECPQVAEWIGNWEMDDQSLGSLSSLIIEAGDGNEQEAVDEWLEDNRDLAESWLTD